MSKYTGPVCRGSWALGTACKRCERCIDTKPSEKQDMGVVTTADREAATGILYCAVPNSFTADGQYKLDMELVAQVFRDYRLASQADQGAEIARLKLDIAAQECLQDSAYKAGLAAGWNFAQDDDNDGFQRARSSTAHIAELKRIRAARQALTSQANGLDPLADLGGPLQSRRDFVEHWRGVVADHGGHTMVANANTVRRLVHIIDALATHPQPSQKGEGDE